MKKIIALESLRGFASVYVALGHWIIFSNTPFLINLIFRFGQEGVIIFFMLSGMVIFFADKNTVDTSLKKYFIKRFRRIYFPLICAFIVSIIFVSHSFQVRELIGNIFMLQDLSVSKPGITVNPFLGNVPLWSLSYEWVFYLIFPFVYPVIKNYESRIHIAGIFCIINMLVYIMFPAHIFLVFAYFLIWWTGLELGEFFGGDRGKFKPKILLGYYLVMLLILITNCTIYYINHKTVSFGNYPWSQLRNFGFAFICFVCAVYFTSATKKAIGLLKVFRFFAPVSYGIYVLHFPIFVQTSFNLPVYAEVLLKIALVLSLAYLVEVILQPRINRLLK